MGVPSFYRWLVNKYPKIVAKAKCAEHSLSQNPNAFEFDNLYLDLNGVIHPCFHPDGDDAHMPTTYEDVFQNVFEYIDLLFSIARPRKLLFLAIDGVAPRAKMNQQRSRRFRSSKDKKRSDELEERLRKEFEVEGQQVLPKVETQLSDSNVITPGTEFMYKLSQVLKDYICLRLKNDAGWRDIKVILSDSNVPVKGSTRSCRISGLSVFFPSMIQIQGTACMDADLIMLALATHEVHFSILREDVLLQEKQSSSDRPFQFLHVWILREYLELDMAIDDPPNQVEFDLERVIDDFIFMCFFAGNDFLPHMPTLEIHEDSIDLLMTVYKEEFKNFGGYLVDMNKVDLRRPSYIKLSRVEKFILKVGTYEQKIFRRRSEMQDTRLRKIQSDYRFAQTQEMEAFNDLATLCLEDINCSNILENTVELKERLKKTICGDSDLFKDGLPQIDKLRLSATGWRERYYKHKFSLKGLEEIESLRKELIFKYTEGLLWVLCYYFSGVPSWTWFYPYYYGPFASDMRGISQLKIKFQKGVPFKPFDQLMSVLPPTSASALPEVYRSFMTDKNSRIIDFYPTDFELDTDGKRYAWQGICKLPFINEERLLAETREIEKELTVEESMMNEENSPKLFERRCGHNSEDDIICASYELPEYCHHVPRLLKDVILPDKIVVEKDVSATSLWHDKQYRRNNTSKIDRYNGGGQKEHKQQFKSTKKSSSSNFIFKEGGKGWFGRGRGVSHSSDECIGGNANPSRGHGTSLRFPTNVQSRNSQNTTPDPYEGVNCWSAGRGTTAGKSCRKNNINGRGRGGAEGCRRW